MSTYLSHNKCKEATDYTINERKRDNGENKFSFDNRAHTFVYTTFCLYIRIHAIRT